MPNNFVITCLGCGAARQIGIVETQQGTIIDWLDNNPDPQVVKIVSGRKRLDGNFGWQCICGNDDVMTDQEKNYIENHQSPSATDISTVIKNLKVQKPRFSMDKV